MDFKERRTTKMRKRDEKNMCGTEAAFTFAMLLLNVLILAVIGRVAWLAHSALAENNALNAILRGGILP